MIRIWKFKDKILETFPDEDHLRWVTPIIEVHRKSNEYNYFIEHEALKLEGAGLM
jgi:hypothetical protein